MPTHKILTDLDVGGEVKGTSLDVNGSADISGDLGVAGALYQTESGTDSGIGVFMPMVQGGMKVTNSSQTTGRLRIKVPTYKSLAMQTFYIDVYEYNTDRSQTYRVSGYNYNDTNATWYNTSVVALFDSDNRDLTVRFGADTSASEQYVSIGETSTTWTYVQVVVRDYIGGYSTAVSEATAAFRVEFVTTDNASYNVSHDNNQPYANWSKIEGTPSNVTNALPTTGGTMSGAIAMGNQNITGAGTITGTTLTGTSLDINGAADISGGVTSGGMITITRDSDALRLNSSSSNGTYLGFQNNTTFKGYIGSAYHLFSSPANNADHLGFRAETQHTFGIQATPVQKITSSGVDVTGTITASGQITGTELEGTSLDINGNADISGNLTGVDTLTATTFSGDLNGTINTATTATTQSASNNSTKVATTAYVDAQVATVVDSAPGTLNTLNELAAALGDDASFSTTITNSIATKMPLAGGTFTGAITMGGDTNMNGHSIYESSENYYSIDLKDHSDYTWLRNVPGVWTFQQGTGGDSWTNSFQLTLPSPGSTANAVFAELGQKTSNAADGRYKGVRIVKYASNALADGDLQAANATFSGAVSLTGGSLSITADGSNATVMSESGSGDFEINTVADIVLDAGGGDIQLRDDGTTFGTFSNSSSDFWIGAGVQDKDIVFRGNDGGSYISALTLDMSEGGNATFAGTVETGGDLTIGGTGGIFIPEYIYHTGDTNSFFGFSSNDHFKINTSGATALTIDSSRDATFAGSVTTTGIILDGNTITGIDNDSEHTANDNHIMTSLAIQNKIADNDNSFLTSVPNHSGNLITSGTVAAARVATLNQNTTGSSGSCTGNAATATALTSGNKSITGTFTVSGNINANGNIVGDDSTAITNISSIGADSYTADADSTTTINMGATSMDFLVADNDIFGLGEDTMSVFATLDITGTTDATNATGDTGILRCEGGASIAKKLYVGSTITGSADVIAFSDRKLKENIETLDGKKVLDMRGVSFTRKDTGAESSGVIAQEIQKVAPELVHDTEGTLGVAYGNLVGYLIEAIKDQQKQIDELKAMCSGCSK